MKKAISLFISLVLVLSCTVGIGFSAFADEWISGECGDSAIWVLDEDGTLTISGEGKMTTYSYRSQPTWCNNTYRNSITKLIIEDGITSIGSYAFYYCQNINELEIPASVTSIESYAFYYCTGIESITFAEGSQLTKINTQAFYKCTSLESITIPAGVTSIGTYAFYGCESLESVIFEDGIGITTIPNYAFEGCTSLTEIVIPDGVTSIGTKAFFDCDSLKDIEIASTVNSIGDSAFSNCSSLEEINVEEGNTTYCSIDGVLYDYDVTEIICYPAGKQSTSYSVPDTFTEIPDYLFSDNSYLETVYIPASIVRIGVSAFNGCSNLQSVVFAENSQLTTIADSAFRDCTSLTTIYIPAGVTEIPYYGFYNCSSLESVVFADNCQLTSIGSCAFKYCTSLLSITIPASVTTISDSFTFCSNLEYVDFEEDSQLTTITNNVFSYCDNLQTVKIPKSLTEISMYAFQNDYALETVIFEEGSQLTVIDPLAFWNCQSLINITLPEGLTTINNDAFNQCVSLIEINIPNTVTSISESAFAMCSNLESISFEENSQLTELSQDVFGFCTSLTEVTLPASIEILDNNVFQYCSSLESVKFEENSNLTSIGHDVFYKCTSLNDILLPDGIQEIGDGAFAYCDLLEHIFIPDSITSIDYTAFYSSPTVLCAHCYNSYVEEYCDTYSRTFIPVHYILNEYPSKAASCKETGNYEYWHCTTCDKYFVEKNIYPYNDLYSPYSDVYYTTAYAGYDDIFINYTDHVWNDGVETKAATCTEDGVFTYTCTVCGITEDETIPATGHDFVHYEYSDPTCTADGHEEYWQCSDCGKYFLSDKDIYSTDYADYNEKIAISATGHEEYSSEITKEATCTEDGEITYTCLKGDDEYTEVIPATGHSFEHHDYAAPSCEDAGNNEYWYCPDCGEYFLSDEYIYSTDYADYDEDIVISATGHEEYSSEITKEPTCTEDGERTYTCLKGDDEYTEVIPATGHTFEHHDAVDASCEDAGNNEYWYCPDCGEYFLSDGDIYSNNYADYDEDIVIPATGHSYVAEVTKEATCTEDGEITYTCTDCGDTYTEVIPATGHTFEHHDAADASCEEDGNNEYWYCPDCGEYFLSDEDIYSNNYADYENDIVIPATGHTYVPEVTKEATDTEDGEITYTCTDCGDTYTETIPATGHTYVHYDYNAPTCTADGNNEYWYCTDCGEYFLSDENIYSTDYADYENDIVIPALGHTAGEAQMENIVEATAESDGSYDLVIRCTVCGEILSSTTVSVPYEGANDNIDKQSEETPTYNDETYVPATEDEDGYYEVTLPDGTVEERTIPAGTEGDPEFNEDTFTAPTEDTDGSVIATMPDGKDVIVVIPAGTIPDYIDGSYVAPTDTEDGSVTVIYPSDLGDVEIVITIPAGTDVTLEYVDGTYTAPTDTEDGSFIAVLPDGTEIRINIPAGTDGVMVQDEDGNWYIEYGTDFGDVEIPVEYTEETAEGAEEETAEEETETEEQEETGSAAVSESSTSPATGAEIFGGIALILLLAFGIAFIVRRKSKE